MITPRRTRILRVADLAGLRGWLVGEASALDPIEASDTFVLVATRAAGEQLRRTIEDARLDAPGRAIVLPRIGTRSDLYETAAGRLPDLPPTVSLFEREVLLAAAAHDAEESGIPPPFHVRPSLIADMLALYDHVRRLGRTVSDFDRLLTAELGPAAESDRGAAQLLEQTRFLVAAFTGYEMRLADVGGADEHGVRAALQAESAVAPVRRVIVTVGDRVSDGNGLWPADAALLTSIAGLESIDILATSAALDAGYLDRLRLSFVDAEEDTAGAPAAPPRLVVPEPAPGGGEAPLHWSYRDREDELEGVARRIKADRAREGAAPVHRLALVVPRPLPYLYLARDVFDSAGVPFEALDTLPLAAEPYASAVDLVLDFVTTRFSRGAGAALLRSPHFRFVVDGEEVSGDAVHAADLWLSEMRYLGGRDRLESLAASSDSQAAAPALAALVAAARELAPLVDQEPLADQVDRFSAFLETHDREPDPASGYAERRRRAKAAVAATLAGLASAYRRHHPGAAGSVEDVTARLRRWLGSQTFATRTGQPGVQIVDPHAARFGDFDDVQLMGLVDGDWPEPDRRSVFYPQALLAELEPSKPTRVDVRQERERLRAARAAFADLLGLARSRTRVSTIALEADAVVEPSVLLDDLATSGLATERAPVDRGRRVFAYEALALEPPAPGHLPAPVAEWAAARLARLPGDDPRYHGEAGPWTLPRVSVSRLERYQKCPFQFYASNVLRLEEEPEDEETRSPLERGRFLHDVFERFFSEWQARGHGRITAATLDEAREVFAEVAAQALAALSPVERALERARLVGSAVGPGMADRVFVMEAERPAGVARRLLEYPIEGVFTFAAEDGSTRDVTLRAKIDRVDLLDDGGFRLIDYKMKLVPDVKTALQLPIYSACVRERLSAERGRDTPPREAMYLSLEGDRTVTPLKPPKGEPLDTVITQAEHRLVRALDDIAAGHFPPRPSERSICTYCPYVGVCREPGVKDAETETRGEADTRGETDTRGERVARGERDGGGEERP